VVKSLEHASLAARLTNLVGKPVELIGYAMPSFASKAIAATSRGLEVALKVALRTPRRRRLPALAGARRLGDRALPGWLPLQWPPMQPPSQSLLSQNGRQSGTRWRRELRRWSAP
jgi:hypothetical protein